MWRTYTAIFLCLVSLGCSQEKIAPRTSTPQASVSEAATPPTDLQEQLVDARRLAAAIEAYAMDHNKYPVASSMTDLQSSLIPTYMNAFPQTPFRIRSTESGYVISAINGYQLLSGNH